MTRLLLAAFAASVAAAGAVVAAQTAPALPGERFENWLFRTPQGWVKREDVSGLTLSSPDGLATMLIVPGEQLSTAGLDTYLNGQLQLQERGLTLESAEPPQTTPTSDHYDWLVRARALRNAQGQRIFRSYFAANPRGRAEVMIATALSQDALRRALPAIGEFIDSVRFANVLGIPKPAPQRLPAVPAVSPTAAERARTEPVADEFSCYVKQMSDDYSHPDFFLQILPGRQYRTAAGTGSFEVVGPASSVTGRVRWLSGPLATTSTASPSEGAVGWRETAQVIILGQVPIGRGGALRQAVCYQRGAGEGVARTTFTRLDPQPGSYRCVTAYGKDPAGTLEILPGRRYRYGGAEGVYAVNIMDSQLERKLSSLRFFGGPFDEGRGNYGDEPPGRPWYSVSARDSLECQR